MIVLATITLWVTKANLLINTEKIRVEMTTRIFFGFFVKL